MSPKSCLSIVTLNVNDINAPMNWHRIADWVKRQYPSIGYLQETHFEPKDTTRLKMSWLRKFFHANGPQNIAGVAILIPDKLYFMLKTVLRYRGTLCHS